MNHDPTDIQGQERAREDAKLRKTLDKDSDEADFKWLMSSKRGRRIVWRMLDRAGVFRLSFNTNSMQMAFAEGGRNEGLRMVAMIHTLCPELYAVMAKEQNDTRSTTPDE